MSEIGWMVLPEFQGCGLGKRAVRMLLELARDDGRWGLVHAFPARSTAPSNGICRSLGFRLADERDVTFRRPCSAEQPLGHQPLRLSWRKCRQAG